MNNISSFFAKEVSKMKIASVISEFNPFHNGHKHLVDTIKKEHADCVVAIMSGNFVQRGDVAITDKYNRAKVALQNGCDLVVELPTAFALSSAQNFALGGVEIAKALNSDMLCFGAENDDTTMLTEIADVFYDDNFKEKIKEYISSGDYYAKAVSKAVSVVLSQEHSDILSKPNNTLAVEYIRALKGSAISPIAIKRIGAEHDSSITTETISSATNIRNLVLESKTYDNFTNMVIDNPAYIKNVETAILYKLRTMSEDDFLNISNISEGFENRIYDACRNSISLEELYENLKTKRYTLARIRRIVMNAFLEIDKTLIKKENLYVRVLGMNEKGAQIIKSTSLPLVIKVKQDYEKLSNNQKALFDIDVKASELFPLALNKKVQSKNDFATQIIKI